MTGSVDSVVFAIIDRLKAQKLLNFVLILELEPELPFCKLKASHDDYWFGKNDDDR